MPSFVHRWPRVCAQTVPGADHQETGSRDHSSLQSQHKSKSTITRRVYQDRKTQKFAKELINLAICLIGLGAAYIACDFRRVGFEWKILRSIRVGFEIYFGTLLYLQMHKTTRGHQRQNGQISYIELLFMRFHTPWPTFCRKN